MSLDSEQEGILWNRDGKVARERRAPPGQHPSIVRSPKPRHGVTEVVHVEEYRVAEMHIFNLLTADYQGGAWGYRYVDVTNGDGAPLTVAATAAGGSNDNGDNYNALTMGFSSEYLYQIYNEQRRPKVWLDRAKSIIKTIADALLNRQGGSPVAFSTFGATSMDSDVDLSGLGEDHVGWGAIFEVTENGNAWALLDATAMGGLAFLRAYQLHGGAQYRAAYLRAVRFIFRMQQSHKFDASLPNYTAGQDGSSRLDTGMWTRGVEMTNVEGEVTSILNQIRVRDLVAMRFLNAVKTQEGDVTIADDQDVAQFYDLSPTSRSLSSMTSLAQAFWNGSGVMDTTGTTLNGFSATGTATTAGAERMPVAYYDNKLDVGGGSGNWQDSSATNTVGSQYNDSIDFAMAIWAWYAQSGYDTKMAEMWTHFMSYASNSSFQTTAGTRNGQLYDGLTGTYDPKVAMAERLNVKDSSTATWNNANSLYDWGSFGLTAEIASARQLGSFGAAKREMSRLRRRAYFGQFSEKWYMPSCRGRTGLTYQVGYTETILSGTRRVLDVMRAAMAGLAYRVAPKVFPVSENNR